MIEDRQLLRNRSAQPSSFDSADSNYLEIIHRMDRKFAWAACGHKYIHLPFVTLVSFSSTRFSFLKYNCVSTAT